jgi:hypothetical protein
MAQRRLLVNKALPGPRLLYVCPMAKKLPRPSTVGQAGQDQVRGVNSTQTRRSLHMEQEVEHPEPDFGEGFG